MIYVDNFVASFDRVCKRTLTEFFKDFSRFQYPAPSRLLAGKLQ
jgi:hypothetical protein